jgi:hypothetical protein
LSTAVQRDGEGRASQHRYAHSAARLSSGYISSSRSPGGDAEIMALVQVLQKPRPSGLPAHDRTGPGARENVGKGAVRSRTNVLIFTCGCVRVP